MVLVQPRRQIVLPIEACVTSGLTTPGVAVQLARSGESAWLPCGQARTPTATTAAPARRRRRRSNGRWRTAFDRSDAGGRPLADSGSDTESARSRHPPVTFVPARSPL